MNTEYLGKKQGRIGIKVIDKNDSIHKVEVGLDGEIVFHGNDDYPHKREERTLEEQKIMTQVEKRARVEAQREFPDEDIMEVEWMPETVERGIQAFQTMPVEEFAQQFETCYEMVTSPESFDGVTRESAQIVWQPFYINDNEEVTAVPTPVIQYKQDGEVSTTAPDPDAPNHSGTKLTISLPPMVFDDGDYEFPDGFQVFCIEHLLAQLRDVYRNMGEEPPGDLTDIDERFPGRPVTAADDEFYDDW